MADEPAAPSGDELVRENRARAEEYSREHDLVLNPDERVRNTVIRGSLGISFGTAGAAAPAPITRTGSPAKPDAAVTRSSGSVPTMAEYGCCCRPPAESETSEEKRDR